MTRAVRARGEHARVVGLIVGAVAGVAVGTAIYLVLNPVLEGSGSWIEELQGLLWNIVPLLTLVGAALGWSLAGRRSRNMRLSA